MVVCLLAQNTILSCFIKCAFVSYPSCIWFTGFIYSRKLLTIFFTLILHLITLTFFFIIVLCCSAGVQCEPPKSIYARISPVLPIYYYGNVVTAECDIGYTIIIVRTHKEASATWWIAFYVNNYTFDNFFRKK